jgi:hypothetical protein
VSTEQDQFVNVHLTDTDGTDPISIAFTIPDGPDSSLSGGKNVVDGLYAIAFAMDRIARALEHISQGMDTEGHLASRIEAGAETIANSIKRAADAIELRETE